MDIHLIANSLINIDLLLRTQNNLQSEQLLKHPVQCHLRKASVNKLHKLPHVIAVIAVILA